MRGFLLNRLSQSLVLLVIVSIIGFTILNLIPGGPLAQYGLDRHDPGGYRSPRGAAGAEPAAVDPVFRLGRQSSAGRLGPLLPRRGAGAGGDRPASLRHAAADGLLHRDRDRDRHLDRHPRRHPPLFGVRLSGDDRRHGRAVDPDLLVRARRHLRLLPAAGLVACRQHVRDRRRLGSRLSAPPDPAEHRAVAGPGRDLEPLHAVGDARRHQPGLRQDRPRQGPERAPDPDEARRRQRAPCR